jgi:hypothetical protein
MNRLFLSAVSIILAGGTARADVTSESVVSLEWVVDSSDYIARVTVTEWNDPGSNTRPPRLVRTVRFLKNMDGDRVPEWSDISGPILTGAWKDVLMFGRKDPDWRTVRLVRCIFLTPHILPTKAGEQAELLQKIIPYREGVRGSEYKCAAIDKHGIVMTDPQRVVEAVAARIRLKPTTYRNTAGLHRGMVEAMADTETVFHLFVPYEPEYRRGFLNNLDDPHTWTRYGAAIHLAHYNDPEVVAALKQRLDDDGLAQLANSRGESTYSVRKAAYESLRSLGVDVPRPILDPPPGTGQQLVTRPVPIAPWMGKTNSEFRECGSRRTVDTSCAAVPGCGYRVRILFRRGR